MDGERARVARLALRFAPAPAGVEVGIGDDAAVLASHAGRALVWTVDTAVEGVHFRRAWLTLVDLGWRSFMAAASDLAAMGATPRGALSSLILPADLGDDALPDAVPHSLRPDAGSHRERPLCRRRGPW